MNLTEFLLARIAEDEAVARACVGINELAAHQNGEPIPRWVRDGSRVCSDDERRILRVGHTWAREADHIVRHDPARVLAECEAKRRIVDLHRIGHDPCDAHDASFESIPCETLEALALPYADHPDYRSEWAP